MFGGVAWPGGAADGDAGDFCVGLVLLCDEVLVVMLRTSKWVGGEVVMGMVGGMWWWCGGV